jgi:hypothetical protein
MAPVKRKYTACCLAPPLSRSLPMPLREAMALAETLGALLPALHAGRVMARCTGLYSGGVGVKLPTPDIPSSWWGHARDIDPASGRAQFTMALCDFGGSYELLATGIELERTAVESLWPAEPQISGRRPGKKPSAVWQQIFLHFDPVVARDGPFLSTYSAASKVDAWLEKNNKALSRRAIERGISKYRPDWVTA